MTALLSIVVMGALVVPAAPIEANKWFTSKDNPKTALAVADRGHIAYTILVAPDGTALRCETKDDTDLDRKVCALVMKRARFTPAKDDAGRHVFGVYEGISSFLMPGNHARPDRSKFAVTVAQLPDGVTSPAFARVAFAVGSDGAVSQCASMVAERRRFMQTVEALGPAACEKLGQDYRPAPARNAAGEPVASVQSITVRFETGQKTTQQP
jgi:hypothetical protein